MPIQQAKLQLHSAPVSVRITNASIEILSRRILDGRVESSFARGQEEGMTRVGQSAAVALGKAVERLDEIGREVERFSAQLAVEIARHIVRAELQTDCEALESIVRETLADSGVGRGRCAVHLNPDDLKALEGITFRQGTELVGDPSVQRGDVQVTTPQGLFVREIDGMLDNLRRHFSEETP